MVQKNLLLFPEGPPTVPEGALFKPEQLSPLRIQEPHSLRISNMMCLHKKNFQLEVVLYLQLEVVLYLQQEMIMSCIKKTF